MSCAHDGGSEMVRGVAALAPLSARAGQERAEFIVYDNAAVAANQGVGNALGLNFNVPNRSSSPRSARSTAAATRT
jgi:hypothetical protein